jgi:hypothetical protein
MGCRSCSECARYRDLSRPPNSWEQLRGSSESRSAAGPGAAMCPDSRAPAEDHRSQSCLTNEVERRDDDWTIPTSDALCTGDWN